MTVSSPDSKFPSAGRAWSAVLVLCAVMICAYVDRNILGILAQPLSETLHVSDTQLGLLQGTAFIMVYAFLGIPAGRLVDRYTRKYLLSVGIIFWSLMTIACGLTTSFWWLFAARVGVGVGEAVLAPATFSMLADFFPPARRGRAIAVVTLSGALGSGLSFILGGAVLDMVPGTTTIALPAIGRMWGWQVAFLVAGLAGLVVGALTLLIAEPGRVTGSKQNLGRTGFLHYAARNSSSLLPVYLGGSLLAAIAYALGAWGAVHFIRSLGLPAAHVGYVMGMLTIVGVVIGGLSGGLISDALVKRRSSGRLDVLIVCACFSIPVLALWPLLPAAYAFTAFFGLMLAKAAVGTGTSTASVMIQEVVPSRMRGEALGYYFFVQGIIGPGLGPISVAMVSDHVFAGPGRLGAALIAVTVPAMLVVGALAWLGRTAYGRVWQVLSSDRADTWPDTQPHGALRN